MRTLLSIWVLLGSTFYLFAQRDSVIVLDEVVLADVKLRQFSDGVKTSYLTDSVARRNPGTFTDNLRYTSALFFKEYGYGMTSTVSFRGTGASQTAVVWNGININSPLTGQTDFNTLLSQTANEVTIRHGGGSTQYGSGAIGGSVHLNTSLEFRDKREHQLSLGYGAFESRSLFYTGAMGTRNDALKVGIGYYASENDFKYLGTDRRNENGAFENANLDIAYGRLLGKADLLKVYNQTFFGDRNFSGTLTAPSNDNYRDVYSRSLLEWTNFKGRKVQRLKAAFLYERYRYYPNSTADEFSSGQSGTFLGNYDYKYRFKDLILNAIVEFQNIQAQGTSILDENRQLFTGMLLLSHSPTKRLRYGVNVRKDWINEYASPMVFALNGSYRVTDSYEIQVSGSKNFRAPTFNDLFWEGAGASGNADLSPETALQAEIGQVVHWKGAHFQLNGFYIRSKDLIQWRPDISGVWSPINITNTRQLGLELDTSWEKTFGPHRVTLHAAYSYTRAQDGETKKQLLYVPLHAARANIAYANGRWKAFLQFLYNDAVYTTTDNSQEVSAYVLGNLGLEYALPKLWGVSTTAGLQVRNLSNTNYQTVAFRPMPNRHLNFQLNFKF